MRAPRVIVGIDLSARNTGLAAMRQDGGGVTPGTILETATLQEHLKKGATVRDKVARASRVVAGVASFLERNDPDVIVIEGPSYGSPLAQFEIGGIHYAVYMMIADRGLMSKLVVMPPRKARLLAFGSGSPPKGWSGGVKRWIAEMVDSAGFSPPLGRTNEHVRDAISLCLAESRWNATRVALL